MSRTLRRVSEPGKLTRTRRRILGSVIEVETITEMVPLAENLLDHLAREPRVVFDNSVLEYGWCPIRLTPYGDVLVVQAPNLLKNPHLDVTADLSTLLWVRGQQVVTAERLGFVPELSYYNDRVWVRKGWDQLGSGALGELWLERAASGWRVSPAEGGLFDSPAYEWQSIEAWQLMQHSITASYAMLLPTGTRVRVQGTAITVH